MNKVLSVELLIIVLILILISLFTYIDSRQFMLEGFTTLFTSKIKSLMDQNGNNNPTNNPTNVKLVLFYADWCGYCKKMKPDWNKFKEKYPNNCEEYESENITDDIRKKYTIQGYPTIIVVTFNNGKEIQREFNGERTFNGFVEALSN